MYMLFKDMKIIGNYKCHVYSLLKYCHKSYMAIFKQVLSLTLVKAKRLEERETLTRHKLEAM